MDLKNFNLEDDKLTAELDAVFADGKSIEDIHEGSTIDFEVDSIVKAKVVTVLSSDVVVDIGDKSEGFVSLDEWEGDEEVNAGDEFEVVFEGLLDEFGVLLLSKRKADKIRGWERLVEKNNEGDVINGKVIRKIKGGLLVDVGVPVFLPASQVDIRKIGDIAEYIGKTIGISGEHLTGTQMTAALSRALGKEIHYNDVSPAVFRSFGFPGADDLGNMFQFTRDFEEVFCGARNPDVSRALNPSLQTFEAWLAKNKDRIPLE